MDVSILPEAGRSPARGGAQQVQWPDARNPGVELLYSPLIETISTAHINISEFRQKFKSQPFEDTFFIIPAKGCKLDNNILEAKETIISLRKKYYSVEDIESLLDSKGINISEKTIYNILHKENFSRLARRQRIEKQKLYAPLIPVDKSIALNYKPEDFKSISAGILVLLPYLEHYGISEIIEKSFYPETIDH